MSDPAGRTVVVTGGNGGIGKAISSALAAGGARVVIAARNQEKAAAAVTEIRDTTGAGDRVTTMPLDLSSFASVRAFAAQFLAGHDRLDALVNNAGLWMMERTETVDGHEWTFQVNHLSHFLLANLLRPALQQGAPARVVALSSGAHKAARRGLDFDDLDWERRRYGIFRAYAASKLANILFVRELARRWAPDAVTANAAHPGAVASNFATDGKFGRIGDIGIPLVGRFLRTTAQGAATPVYLATSAEVAGRTGGYYYKDTPARTSAAARDDAAAARLWDVSLRLTGLA